MTTVFLLSIRFDTKLFRRIRTLRGARKGGGTCGRAALAAVESGITAITGVEYISG